MPSGVVQWLDATLNEDETLMLFSGCGTIGSNTSAGCDIYQANLNSGSVTSVARVDSLSSADGFDRHPTLSKDGKRLFLLRPPGRIYVTERASALGMFSAPTQVTSAPPTGESDTDPFIARDGKLYFGRGSAIHKPVHYAAVSATAIDTATALAGNLVGIDPVMANETADFLLLAEVTPFPIVASSRRRMLVSERTGAAWSAPSEKYVAGLNVAMTSNFANWVSADGCRLYFSRGTSVGGGYKLMIATRPK
jgi:hypothetical protein